MLLPFNLHLGYGRSLLELCPPASKRIPSALRRHPEQTVRRRLSSGASRPCCPGSRSQFVDYLAEESPVSLEASSLQECPPEHADADECASHSQAVLAFKMQAESGRGRQPLRRSHSGWALTGDVRGFGKGHKRGCWDSQFVSVRDK